MSGPVRRSYDLAVVGAGPVGSLCALAHARKGARVALLEANPRAARRLAGEWLHPPAVRTLREMDIDLDSDLSASEGKGFVVLPEDGGEPIRFPYPDGARGLVCEHEALVARLRETVAAESGIDYLVRARVREIEGERVAFSLNSASERLIARRVVGADGRASAVRRSLGLSTGIEACSRMIGVVLNDVHLPLEGYGHLLLGGPGPILIYRVAERRIRVIVDIPLDHWAPGDPVGLLLDAYASLMPETIRPVFVEALHAGKFHAAANGLRPRVTYGSPDRVLIGDAAGHYHPMTAMGMTLGFGDAHTLAESENFDDFANRRFLATRAPELLAMGLYEVFADQRPEAVVLRHAVYRNWRANPAFRQRTVGLLSCEDTSLASLGLAFGATVARAVAGELPRSYRQRAWRQPVDIVHRLFVRLKWALQGAWELGREKGTDKEMRSPGPLARAFLVSMPDRAAAPAATPAGKGEPDPSAAERGLRRAKRRLVSLQREDGAWEGPMAWCPMLTAQYVLLHYVLERPLDSGRRRRVLRHFKRTRLAGGGWGLHEHGAEHLFVTALVYVAARLLGVEPGHPLVEPARRFLHAEGVLNIPSWGKFWLAVMNLYDWRGVNAVLPELWSLPRWFALHPSNWYCHTRLIYMAMAAIYPHRFKAPLTPLIESLREELFPQGYEQVDFPSARNRLRSADLFARPSAWLRFGYALARVFERFHSKALRARCVAALRRRIRWELQSSSHTSISPVSGMLNILALWLDDPGDGDCAAALEKLEDWIWEDEADGAWVTGARSASWDTGFALQALAAVRLRGEGEGIAKAVESGAGFLLSQQIRESFDGFREAYRSDPRGGWCFAGGWHGWPVTDCTAEAALGIIASQGASADPAVLGDAVGFMLRGQNRDGGFGSYEARRLRVGLEWLNPAEMFGESMTEHSFVECTASCLAALAACRTHFPEIIGGSAFRAMSRADIWLRRTQGGDGSWRGVWGVQFIYGTFFGIRGLVAAGARPGEPALRLACRWLLDRQRGDGGWGEHHSGCFTGRYVEHEQSQIIQTAWALIALLEAGDSNWNAISRGVRFLLDAQDADGGWPRQDNAGVFFRTALLDYALYRQYFPLHALGLYEQRLAARLTPVSQAA